MENASKALLMAGGILIALLVIGSVLLMFNQIGNYRRANTDSEKSSQIADFNKDFVRYADGEEIKGVDIISLANKVVDYNQKKGTANSVDYNKKITLKINLAPSASSNFITTHGKDGKSELFDRKTNWTVSSSDTQFVSKVTQFAVLESQYTLGTMSKLSANYDSIVSGDKTASQVAGKNVEEIDRNHDIIKKYREYSEFKSSTFINDSEPKYDNGQVVEISFKFVK
mgnify:FL=1